MSWRIQLARGGKSGFLQYVAYTGLGGAVFCRAVVQNRAAKSPDFGEAHAPWGQPF